MIEIWYDNDEDILAIQVAKGKYWKSVEVARNVVVDLSNAGKIIGVEIFQAKRVRAMPRTKIMSP
jgi:uncharacterized protein YuzE